MITALAFFSYFLIFALLAALAWRDLKEYILPNLMNAALAISFCSFHISTGWSLISPPNALVGAAVGGGFLLAIGMAADHFYKKDSLGMGDVKLMAAAGLGLGFPNILLAMSIGAFAGLLHGAVISLYHEKKTGERIPFGEINVPAGLGLTVGIAIVVITQFGFSWVDFK